MTNVTNLFVISMAITGLAVIALTLMPFAMYANELRHHQRTGATFAEISTKIFLYHILTMLLACALFGAWEIGASVAESADFDPKRAITAFLNIGGSSDYLTYWNNVAHDLRSINYSSNSVSAKAQGTITTLLGLVCLMGLFYAVVLFFLPFICLFAPMFMVMRFHKRNREANENKVMAILRGILFGAGGIFMMTIHFAIVNTFVSFLADKSFAGRGIGTIARGIIAGAS